MLSILRFLTLTTVYPDFPNPTIFSFPPSPVSKRTHCCHLIHPPPMAPPSSITAAYAKSNRSSCKVCSKSIDSKALRLGLVTKDPRGYDAVKWHHLACFPLPSHSLSSPERDIKGFSSLKSSDQEAVKKLLVDGHDKFQEKVDKATDDIENERQEIEASDSKKRKVDKATDDIESERQETEASDSKKRKVDKAADDIENELQETEASDSKKRKGEVGECLFIANKLCASDVKGMVAIEFSVSDVKSKYKDAALLPKWKAFQTVIFLERDNGLRDSSKIAAFDFDGCLARTDVKKTGPRFWSLMYPSIPDKLQSLYNDGFKLVIFTNESNIERWKNKRQVAVDSKIGRLNNFIEEVKVPIQVFIACGLGKPKSGKDDKKEDDPFRKPKTGMWQLMEQHFNSSIAIDMDQSFYVGDAAGRISDHSDADIKFAEAIGLKFYVPEEYFLS